MSIFARNGLRLGWGTLHYCIKSLVQPWTHMGQEPMRIWANSLL
jgi:hypothetical protein